jgi:hypothetical protein
VIYLIIESTSIVVFLAMVGLIAFVFLARTFARELVALIGAIALVVAIVNPFVALVHLFSK